MGNTIRDAIKTLYPTKDWVISDFIVTDPKYGARAEPGFDNRSAFQAAIDAASADGGGVVYIPAGNYEFRSSVTGIASVTVKDEGTRQKPAPTIERREYRYALNLPPGVQLRGDKADPDENGGKVLGTILEVRTGKDSLNYDGYADCQWRDGQAGNILHTTKTSVADRFIQMNHGTGVTNLSVWYPEQDINDVKPYPWTFYQVSDDNATLENVTLVNSYNGFYSAPSELHFIYNCRMTALSTGVEIHICTDIGRIENVFISPECWARSGLLGSPSLKVAEAYTLANATGFKMHRSDWEYVYALRVSGCKTGMWVGREPGFSDAPNAQFYKLHMENCVTAFEVESVNPYGLLISDSIFNAREKSVSVGNLFETSIQFSGTEFSGSFCGGGRGGVISFEDCAFDTGDYDVKLDSGTALLSQCVFKNVDRHIYLGKNAKALKSVNSVCRVSDGPPQRLRMTNESAGAEVFEDEDEKYVYEPFPKNVTTDIAAHPKTASGKFIRADLPRVTGDNDTAPSVCVSEGLRALLDEAAAAGGGTVYLPGGRYLLDKPIVIPSGVELRGSWDVPHHTQSGGTAILTHNGIENRRSVQGTAPLIGLSRGSGIRGVTFVQLGQRAGDIPIDVPAEEAYLECPFMVRGLGPDVYVVNATFPNADKGIDLATCNADRHYVEYVTGSMARAGVWVGGGAEGGFIRNVQFNPHYGTRLPKGGHGYPETSLFKFQRENYSALKFGDVKNQTIFFNFVYGSKNGIHFLKDEVTGRNPKEMTVIGHGTDGSTFGLFVADADADTRILLVNSELVTLYSDYKAYVLVGDPKSPGNVHPDSLLAMYNSAFWGRVDNAVVVNSGTVRLQQANIVNTGDPAIVVNGGRIHVYDSYFQQVGVKNHARVETRAEFTNNVFEGELRYQTDRDGSAYGRDANRKPASM